MFCFFEGFMFCLVDFLRSLCGSVFAWVAFFGVFWVF